MQRLIPAPRIRCRPLTVLSLLLLTVCGARSAGGQDPDLQQRQLLQLMNDIRMSLDEQNWLLATRRFDAAWEQVCSGEDPVLVLANEGRQQLEAGQHEVLAGARARLTALFATAPEEFRDEYRRQFAQLAEQQLDTALQSSRLSDVEDCARRYAFTPVAAPALKVLIRRAIDRGDFLEASLRVGHLLHLPQTAERAPDERNRLRLQRAVLQFRGGLTVDAVETVRALRQSAGNRTIRIADRQVTLPDSDDATESWLADLVPGRGPAEPGEWTQPLGSCRRVAFRPHGPPRLRNGWQTDLFTVHDVLFADELNPLLQGVPDRLQLLAARHLLDNRTIYPAATPLIVDGRIIFRSAAGIQAVSAESGELIWEIASPDSRLRQFVSMLRRSGDDQPAWTPAELQRNLAAELLHQLTQSNTGGQLATDGTTLYVVEDSAPAYSTRISGFGFSSDTSAAPANFFRAYDLESGLLKWEAGGQRAVNLSPNLLAGFYFLGAPLIVGDRCYVLAENGDGIYLLQLRGPDHVYGSSLNPRIVHSQLLAVPRYPVDEHPVRRMAGLTPSFAQDLLICPTCDERIIAVSAQDHSVRWIYRYADNVGIPELGDDRPVLAGSRDEDHSGIVDLETRWVDSLPRIAGRHVLVTPRDANELLCLDVTTGAELWRRARGLARNIVAVVDDRILLSGNKRVEAVRLSDGATLWSGPVHAGQICGTGLCDGRVLQIPTSLPSIESFDVATGRRLLSQPLLTAGLPGNLLSHDGRLVWQSLTAVAATGETDTADESPTAHAAELLLAGDVPQATSLLEQAVQDRPADAGTRELLIAVLLESLRLDYAEHSARVPQLRELIGQTTSRSQDVVPLIDSLLGVTLNDAAILPLRLESVDRAEQQLDELFELIASGLGASRDGTVDDVAATVGGLLPVLRSTQERITSTGFLDRRNALLLAAGIRRVVEGRSEDERRRLHEILAPRIRSTFDDLAFDEAFRVLRTLQFADLGPDASATDYLQPATDEQTARVRSLRDQLRLDAVARRQGSVVSDQLTELLNDWSTRSTQDTIAVLAADLRSATADHRDAALGFFTRDTDAARSAIASFAETHPNLTAAPEARRVWTGTPEIALSDDRTTSPESTTPVTMPQYNIPVFGDAGCYRDWSFAQESGSRAVVAFDRFGHRRWAFDPQQVVSPLRTGRLQENYILVQGHTLAVKLHDHLYMVDAADAGPEQPPIVLWDTDIAALNRDEEADVFREFTPGSERISQYAPEPAGHFPAGPLLPHGLPILAGRRLIVFDTLTGSPMWQLEGLALDSVLLGHDDRVIVVSQSARQVESRNLISGDLLSVTGLPDWWTEAEINVGMSVRQIELEAGTTITWRAAAFRDRCLLFRLSPDATRLELRRIVDDSVIWERELPADSVFSNAHGNTIAVLSNRTELRLFRIDTGTEVSSESVPAVGPARHLYLRGSPHHWLVLPEAVEDPSYETDPVIGSLHVHGHIYAVSRETGELAWTQPIEHAHIRQTTQQQFPILPNAPVLVLVSRIRLESEFGGFSTRMRARVFDTRTGERLFDSGEPDDGDWTNLGRTLNGHGLHIDAPNRRLLLGFETRDVTFQYPED